MKDFYREINIALRVDECNQAVSITNTEIDDDGCSVYPSVTINYDEAFMLMQWLQEAFSEGIKPSSGG